MAHSSRRLARALLGVSLLASLFFGAPSAHAILPSPVLADPVIACSGINPLVTLTWSAVSGATSYAVFKDGSGTPLFTTTQTTVDDGVVAPTETHTYTIQAQSATDTSQLSNAKSAIIPHCGTVVRLISTACFSGGPEIKIAWDALPSVSSYTVLRDGIAIASPLASQTDYTDTTAIGGESYTYAIRATWPGDTKDSNDLPISTPACPVTLVVNGNCNAPGANATLSWSSLPGILSYEIFRDGSYLVSRSGTSFDDSDVVQKLSYNYKIRALYANNIADSLTIPVTIPRCAPVLTAQNICNAANPTIPEVKLSWSETADATVYNITESVKGFIAQLVGNPPAASYTDIATIQNGTSYTYAIHAQGSGFSPELVSNTPSVVANCTTTTTPSPAPQVSVTPVCSAGATQMSLSWTPANNTLYYEIGRTNNTAGTGTSWNVSSGDTTATDQSVELNTSYTYQVQAVGSGGPTPSAPVTLNSINCALPSAPSLGVPTTLCTNSHAAVDLSWVTSSYATGYEIYQNGLKTQVISDPTITTYRDQSPTNSTSYTYAVHAVGPGGTTSSGAPRSVVTLNCAPPSAPVLTVGVPVCSGTPNLTIPLTWTTSSNVLYYNIYRRRTGDAGFSPIQTNVVVTSFTDSGLAQNIPAVDYFIEAVGAPGTIPPLSNQAGRATPWCAPLTPAISTTPWCVGSSATINVSWSIPGTPGLVAGYALDEAAGLRANSSMSTANAGTLLNGPSWTAGKNAGALNFDGGDDYVSVPLVSGTGGATNNVTISAWIRPSTRGSYRGIFESRSNGFPGLLLSGASGNPLTYGWENTSDEYNASTGLTLANGRWYFAAVVITPNNATVSLYDDNAGTWTTWTNTKPHTARPINGTWHIGQDPSITGRNWNGRIDDVRIYNRALTPAEIQTDMATPLGAAPLVTSYTLDRIGRSSVASVPPTTNYADNPLVASQSYSYRVTATGQGGSVTSSTASATTLNCAAPTAPIVSWTAQCGGSTPQIKLTWSDTANTVSYDIFRGATKLTATPLPYTGVASYSFTDTTGQLNANTAYSYSIVANGLSGSGTASSGSISTLTSSCTPSQPASFTLTPQCGGSISRYALTWSDPTPSNTTSYDVRRDGNTTPVRSTTALSWTDNNSGVGFPANQNHSYTVTAVGLAGQSVVSPTLSATSLDCSMPGKAVLALSAPMCVGGTALSFDGMNDYINCGTNVSALKFTSAQSFSVEAWVNPRRSGVWQGVITYSRDATPWFGIWIDGSNRWVFGSSSGNATGPTAIFNAWQHIVVVQTGSVGRKIFLNGAEVYSDTAPKTVNGTGRCFIGGSAGVSEYFGGLIDEPRIYNRALTQAEITAHHSGGAGQYGIPEARLIAGWHLDEGTGTIAGDYSGANLTGTLVSGPIWTATPIVPSSGANAPYVQMPMQWDATSNTSSYQVMRGSTVIATIASIPALATYTYSNTSSSSPTNILTSNTTYTYRINSLNAGGGLTASNQKTSATTPWCSPTPPVLNVGSPAPFCSAGKSSFSLAWIYPQPYVNTTSFDILRDGGGGMVSIANPASSGNGKQNYSDTNGGAGLTAGSSYTYQIAGVGPSGLRTSALSIPASAISCSIGTLSKNSLCTSVPGTHPVTLLTRPLATNSVAVYTVAKKEQPAAVFNQNYLVANNYSAASPTTIRQWLLLGPFPNNPDPTGFSNDYIDADPNSSATEATILPRAGETIGGKTWVALAAPTTSDYVDVSVSAAFGPQTNVIGYAFAYVVNTTSSPVSGQLRLGSDDGIKVFFNGDQLYTFARQTSSARDSQIIPVTLKPGVNTLLVKISQIGGGWGFWARLTDSAGNALVPTITLADSAVTKGVSSDYYVWSPGLVSSPVVTETAPLCEVIAPSASASASCLLQQGRILLTWTPTDNTAYYHVYRSSFSDFSQAVQLTAGNAIFTDPSLTSYTYTDLNVEQNKDYYYSVEAVGGGSKFSPLVPITSSVCVVAPDKPNLTSSGVVSLCAGTSPRVTLDWPDTANTVSSTVYRDNAPLTPSVTGSAFTDQSGLVANTAYTYKVQATGSGGATFSDPVVATALNCSGPPIPPELNPPSPLSRSTHIYLSWRDNSINEDGFRIIRRVTVARAGRSLFANLFDLFREPRPFAQVTIATLPADTVFTVDTTAQEDTWYEYQVEAYNSAGATNSNPQKIYDPILPPASFTLTTSCASGNIVNLDWTPGAGTTPAGGLVTYNAYWGATPTGSFSLMAPPCSANITGTLCSTAVPDPSALVYKVTAMNNGGTTDATVSTRCAVPRYEEIRPQ